MRGRLGYRFPRPMRVSLRSLSRAVVGFGLAVGVGVLPVATANAQGTNTLESSSPASGETVTTAPTQIQLRFADALGGAEQVAKMVISLSCDSKLTNLGAPQLGADGRTVSAALLQIPGNGNCTVNWGHPDGSRGSFGFVAAFTENSTATTTIPVDPTDDTNVAAYVEPRLGGPIGMTRLAAFFLVSVLVGGLLFIRAFWPEGVEYDITERFLRQASIGSLASIWLLCALMNARETGGAIAGSLSPTSWGPLMELNDGRALVVRLVAVGFIAWISWFTERIFDPSRMVPYAVAVGAVLFSFGFDRANGRAIALGVLVAVLHSALVLLWIGSIAMIWRVVLHGPGDVDLVYALRGWHRIATPLGLGVIITGVVQTWRIDGLNIFASSHGRLVILKSLVVAAMFIVSGALREFVLKGLRGAKTLNERMVWRLKRPVGVELSLSILVVALSSWLLSMRPPYIAPVERGPQAQWAIVQDMEGEDGFRVRVSVNPGNVGVNVVLIELFGPKRVQNLTVSLTPTNPSYSGYTIYVPLERVGAALVGEAVGMQLRAPGEWKIQVTAVSTVGDLPVLTGSFIIADGTTVTTLPNVTVPSNTTSTVPGASSSIPGVTNPSMPTTTTTTLPGG